LPFATVSLVEAGAEPSAIGFGACAGSAKPAKKVFRYWTTSFTSASVSFGHAGIEVYGIPIRTTRFRSSSVGRAPEGVVRSLNLPLVKSRGRGCRCTAAGPSPSPFSPWHWMQCCS
jgi:hypothetical protein